MRDMGLSTLAPIDRASRVHCSAAVVLLLHTLAERAVGAPSLDLDDLGVAGGIADDRHRVLTALHLQHVLFQELPIEEDALVTTGQVLGPTIGNRSLGDPGYLVLQRNRVGDQA